MPPESAALEACAQAFGAGRAADATTDEVLELLNKEPEVPKDIYVQLVLAAETSVGFLRSASRC